MTKATEILDKHCIEFRDEFLNTNKMRKLKDKILAAMEEYKTGKPKNKKDEQIQSKGG